MVAQVFGALLVIFVGLLFVDLVPLQENMMCEAGTYANASECPDAVFSQTYFDARAKFRAAAKAAGAQLSSYTIVEEDNFLYTTDVAVLVGKKKGSLVVHISGTHGVEGFIGSAIQTDLLNTWNSSRADGATIVFVHAVNPYGMAHFRRFNEHNVDLNRNVMWSDLVTLLHDVALGL
ncbi:membrane-associated protein, putative [Bodo saltans]|uniref:Membrane-associated protein, putative n=1 Tax=Bodo saltans TaxID=75058 RepID=A0A0S4ITH4_BODSA|nr:membrane-associated protein, putative [Bodo saltans]|eukprot:CUF83659.1 membrane-associated protein, putative [Bodo saltans]